MTEGVLGCTFETWSPGIGDPGPRGWITVAAYLAAAVLALRAGRGEAAARVRLFWFALGAGLLLLAVNKQLDLQSALTAAGRCAAKAGGWYDHRAGVQRAFVGTVGLSAVIAAAALATFMRRHLCRLWPAILGACALLAFVAIRAAGFHHVDRLIGQGAFGVTVNLALELGGLALIAWGAARAGGGAR